MLILDLLFAGLINMPCGSKTFVRFINHKKLQHEIFIVNTYNWVNLGVYYNEHTLYAR